MPDELEYGHRNRGLNHVKRGFMKQVWERGFGVRKTKMRNLGHLAHKVKTRFRGSNLRIEEAEDLVKYWFIDCYGEDEYRDQVEKESSKY